MSDQTVTRCPSCASDVAAWEAFCEGCGAQLSPTQQRPHEIVAEDVPISRVTPREPNQPTETAARPCTDCGGRIDADGYCELCGSKAQSERDHFAETPAGWVGGVCDRGVRHHRNEDAMALSADPGPGSHAVLIVCDGVSSSDDSHLASMAAAKAARGLLVAQRPQGVAVPETKVHQMTASFTEAVRAANAAVVEATDSASRNAASCTFAGAEVDGDVIVWANIGDSRVYWIADVGESAQLSVDDSMAQLNIAAGMDQHEAEAGPDSHAITRWLGADAPDLVPTTGHVKVPGDGWLLVCSDGLWNYASTPAEIETVMARILLDNPATADPTLLAREMVRWANAQGGRDNITVALARFGVLTGLPVRTDSAEESPIGSEVSTPTGHTNQVRPGTAGAGDVDVPSTPPDGRGQRGSPTSGNHQ